MAQDDKMNEKGDSTSLRKAPSSVVDDFLQALFARHPPPVSEEEIGEAKIATPNQEEQQQQHSTTATGAERDRSPDEFDEYEMLSKRKDQNIFDGSKPPMAAAQRRELKVGKPEIHMVARRLPPSIKKRDLLDHFSKYGTILDAYVLNASGHVQFDNAESCQTAVQEENGKILKGAVLELEIVHRPSHKPYRERPRNRTFVGRARVEPANTDASASQPPTHTDGYQGNYSGSYRSPDGYLQRDGQHEIRQNAGLTARRPYARGSVSSSFPRAGRGSPGGMKPYPQRQDLYSRTNEFGNQNRSDMQSMQYNGPLGTNGGAYTDGYTQRRDQDYQYQNAARGMGRPPMHGPLRGRHYVSESPKNRGRGGGPMRNNYTPQYSDHRAERQFENTASATVPYVQMVVLGNVNRAYTDEIERSFRARSISIRTRHFKPELFSRTPFVTGLVTEGVKALIIIDERKHIPGKVYLQVFAPGEGPGGVNFRYDEYDSISVEDALAVIEKSTEDTKLRQMPATTMPTNGNTLQQMQYPSQAPSQAPLPLQHPPRPPAPAASTPGPTTTSAAPTNLLDPAILSSLINVVQGITQPNTLDPNVLTNTINMLKGMVQAPSQPQQQPQQPITAQSPQGIPQSTPQFATQLVPASQPAAPFLQQSAFPVKSEPPQQSYNRYNNAQPYSPTQATTALQGLPVSTAAQPQQQGQLSNVLNNNTIQQLLASIVGNPPGASSVHQQPPLSIGNFMPSQSAPTQTQPFLPQQQQFTQPEASPAPGANGAFSAPQLRDIIGKLQFLTGQQNSPLPQLP